VAAPSDRRRDKPGFTLIDLFFTIALVIAAYLVLAFFLRVFFGVGLSREEARRRACKHNLSQIQKALAAYTQDNGGYYPFAWQKSGAEPPAGIGTEHAAMAMTSIGNLYPRYMPTAKLLGCPSTENDPSFALMAQMIPPSRIPRRAPGIGTIGRWFSRATAMIAASRQEPPPETR